MSKQVSVKRAAQKAKSEDAKLRKLLGAGASDSFQNFAAKLGYGTDNLTSDSTYGFNPITRQRTLLEWIHRGSWIGGVAVDVVADDMTRAGITIQGEMKPDAIQLIEKTATSLKIWEKINETIRWGRLYGGAIAVYLIDGHDVSTPLRLDTVGRKQFKGLYVMDRWMVEPSLNRLISEFGPNLGKPKFYRVVSDMPAFQGKNIHHSRVLRIDGVKLPYWQQLMENLWSISVLERLYDRMIAFDSATTGAAQLVYKCYLRTYKVEGLRELISSGGQGLEGLVKYVDMMRRFQSMEGITLLDKEDEFEDKGGSGASFAGLSDALIQFGQQLAGALQIPLVRLFGQSPAGLNSTGESDLRMYYDGIRQQQEAHLLTPVTNVYKMIGASVGIPIPSNFAIEFNPLWQLTDKEKAEVGQTVTETVARGLEAGLVSPQTAMRELRQSSTISGVWSNITDEDIEKAEEELPPSPQELQEQSLEQQRQQGNQEGDGEQRLKLVGKDNRPYSVRGHRGKWHVVEWNNNSEDPSNPIAPKIGWEPVKGTPEFPSAYKAANWALENGYSLEDYARRLAKPPGQRDTTSRARQLATHHDIQVVIENPEGSTRKGGNWEATLAADYGYIRGKVGADGDQLDCFIGPVPESDKVFIIDQKKERSDKFDEHKILFGYNDKENAMEDYQESYDRPDNARVLNVTELSMKEFKHWLENGDLTKPYVLSS